jgi:hypothetical protein
MNPTQKLNRSLLYDCLYDRTKYPHEVVEQLSKKYDLSKAVISTKDISNIVKEGEELDKAILKETLAKSWMESIITDNEVRRDKRKSTAQVYNSKKEIGDKWWNI